MLWPAAAAAPIFIRKTIFGSGFPPSPTEALWSARCGGKSGGKIGGGISPAEKAPPPSNLHPSSKVAKSKKGMVGTSQSECGSLLHSIQNGSSEEEARESNGLVWFGWDFEAGSSPDVNRPTAILRAA